MPEFFTEEEIKDLIMGAEKWLEFCRNQPKTENEKQLRLNACARCYLTGSDLCGSFQNFFRARQTKLEKEKQRIEKQLPNFKEGIEKITNLKDFLDGKREAP